MTSNPRRLSYYLGDVPKNQHDLTQQEDITIINNEIKEKARIISSPLSKGDKDDIKIHNQNKEWETLDKKTQTFEKEMKGLTKYLEQLERTFLNQKDSHDKNNDDLQALIENEALFATQQKKRVQKALPSHTDENELTKENERNTIDQILQMLEEERRLKIEIREHYEKQLSILRKKVNEDKPEERKKVLQEFDYVIQKYYALAVDVTKMARAERDNLNAEKITVQRHAEAACKIFEREVKNRTKKALDEYRKLAEKAHLEARKERNEAFRHCSELESAVERERKVFLASIIGEAERRVTVYKNALQRAEKQKKDAEAAYNREVDSLCDEVEEECKAFEHKLFSVALKLFEDHGIAMTRSGLLQCVDKSAGVPLRSTVPERAKNIILSNPNVSANALRNNTLPTLPLSDTMNLEDDTQKHT